MPSRVSRLISKNLLNAPIFLQDNVHYEVIMGSTAYGCNSEASSDEDIYGFCIPPKHFLFPHLAGEIAGFGKQLKRFDNYQQHHVQDPDKSCTYDIDIYNIARYFQLCSECNPNMVDSLFVPQRCVTWATQIGQKVRDNRKLFLHKGSFHKFRGYAYSQLHKICTKTPDPGSKRAKVVAEFGFDVKFAYHVVRLCLECEQILTEGDIDLERNREVYKAIRRGSWNLQKIEDFFNEKEKVLEKIYGETNVVPYACDETAIKNLLIECLEMHYKDLKISENATSFNLERYMEILEELKKMGTLFLKS